MHRRIAALLLLVGLAGCEPTREDGSAHATALSSSAASSTALSSSAASSTAPSLVSSAPSVATAPSASAPASPPAAEWWPPGVKEITVSWVLHPAQVIPGTPQLGRLVEVTAIAGTAHRTVPIQVRTTIFFAMYGQPDCDPKWRRERGRSIVSELFMNGAGNFMGSIERTEAGIDVYTNDSPDGICDDSPARKPCPVDRKLIGTIPLPEGVTLRVRFVDVQPVEAGKAAFREVPQTCPT